MPAGQNPLKSVFIPAVTNSFLGDGRRDLFSFVVQNESGFKPAQTAKGVVTDFRVASVLDDALFGSWKRRLKDEFVRVIPGIAESLKCSNVGVDNLEIELVRHGDGAFYRRHIDTLTGDDSRGQIRVLSLVYYFHGEQKAFSGGELRIFAISASQTFIDVEPVQDRLVAFPSWAPHEVRPIACPSGRFEDSRFAVNCWVRSRA